MRRQMREKRFRFAERVDFKPGRLKQPGNRSSEPMHRHQQDKQQGKRQACHTLTVSDKGRNQTLVPGLTGESFQLFAVRA